MRMHWFLVGLLIAALGAGVAAVATAATAPDVGFDWSVPPGYGLDRDHDGLVDAMTTRETIDPRAWPVRLRLSPSACDHPQSAVRWTADGDPLDAARLGSCLYEAKLPREGTYDIEVSIVADGTTATASRKVTIDDLLIASLGDSVASGEGNPERRVGGSHGQPLWQDERCHRSALSGTAQAAAALERASDHTSVTFVHLACSGATVLQGVLGPYAGVARDAGLGMLPAQLPALNDLIGERHVDALVLSVGANDIHFSSIVVQCLKHRRCSTSRFHPAWQTGLPKRSTLDDVVRRDLADLPDRYALLADEVGRRFPGVPVYLLQYFDPTRGPDGDYCPKAAHGRLRKDELQWAYEHVLQPLNAAVARAADRRGWHLIDGVAAAFGRNGYCAVPASRYIRTISESLRFQHHRLAFWKGAVQAGAFHPNEAGHLATSALIAAAISPAAATAASGAPGQATTTTASAPTTTGADAGDSSGTWAGDAGADSGGSWDADTAYDGTTPWYDALPEWLWAVVIAATLGLLGLAVALTRRGLGHQEPLRSEPFVANHMSLLVMGAGGTLLAAGVAMRETLPLSLALAVPGAGALIAAPLSSRLVAARMGSVELHFARELAEKGLDPGAAPPDGRPPGTDDPKTAALKLRERHERLLEGGLAWLRRRGYHELGAAEIRHGYDARVTKNGKLFGVEAAVIWNRRHLRQRLREIRRFDEPVHQAICVFDASLRYWEGGLRLPGNVGAIFVGEDGEVTGWQNL